MEDLCVLNQMKVQIMSKIQFMSFLNSLTKMSDRQLEKYYIKVSDCIILLKIVIWLHKATDGSTRIQKL